ncbi:helix-turn-helix transcriptional regulator [Endothiovibrio diazotrophicus]
MPLNISERRAHRLSELLLRLHHGSREIGATHFKGWALEQTRAEIPFDRALWAMGAERELVIHGVHLQNLPPHFMENYERFKHHDRILAAVLQHPRRAFFIDEVYAPGEREQMEMVKQHSRRFDIEYAVVVAMKEPVTGLFNVVSLYRGASASPFEAQERLLLELLIPHLVESADLNRLRMVQHRLPPPRTAACGNALCDDQGVLHQAEPRFTERLRAEWPEWSGAQLPTPLVEALLNRRARRFIGQRITVQRQTLDDIHHLTAREAGPVDHLSQREDEVARLLADGASYKTIARRLAISASTVNKHAHAIYAKLGLKNKTELAKELRGDEGEA